MLTSSLASLAKALAEAAFPALAFFAVGPFLWLMFRSTWKELDREAAEHQTQTLASGGYDKRTPILFAITAFVLTFQETQYYGGNRFFYRFVRPVLADISLTQLGMARYEELYGFAWWTLVRVTGYIVVPFIAWKIMFRKDSLLDMGLRTRGFLRHAWIYACCLIVVLPIVYVVSRGAEFGGYYPFYKQASRSWVDLIAWELMYFAQFFALEVFFRGFWLSALRKTLGSGAIFAMCVPYCMIHYGKPYLETSGALIAGIFLGSLAMRTRSIYAGFLVHITVALSMDILALVHRNALPTSLWGG